MQEREQKRVEKIERDAYLKEWSRSRDDMECDDLKVTTTDLAAVVRSFYIILLTWWQTYFKLSCWLIFVSATKHGLIIY